MSKIFEALQGARSEAAELIPSLLEADGTAGETDRQPQYAPPVNGSAVNGAVANGSALNGSVAAADAAELLATLAPAVEDRPGRTVRQMRLTIPASVPVLPFEDPGEQASEQYRIARTKIVHHPRKPRLITVTSPSTGDGKTITAINMAGALSLKASAKVLLVDADFRRSAVHALLGLPRTPGLAEVISGECSFDDAVIEAVEYPHLHILASGEPKANPSELLETPQWRAFCGLARERYEYAIMDAPPIGSVADSDLIQLSADGVIMILRPDYTRRGNCAKALESVPKDKLLGVLLNGTRSWPFGHHGDGYGYGYGYGYKAVARETAGKPNGALKGEHSA
jgi:protein-tyrosine kinase